MSKLTKAQVRMLGGAASHATGRISGASITNRTAEVLARLDLVSWESGRWFGGNWYLTDLGRQALNPSKDKDHGE